MIVKELYIIEFGGLTDKRIDLSEGLNIIEGNNETGKSTLWLFIKFMLYGMPKKGHVDRDRAINRSTHRASGTMTFLYRGEEYRIERSFSDNSRGRVTCYRTSDGAQAFWGDAPGEAILGVPKDIFENSAAIGQGDCAGLEGSKGATAIRNILTSADEELDVDKIRKKLDSVRVKYRHVNGKGGMLYTLSEEKSGLSERLRGAVENRLQIRTYEDGLRKNKVNIENAEKELEATAGLVERLNKREILQRFDALAEDERRLSEIREARERLLGEETRDGYVPFAADGAALSMTADSLESAQRDFETAAAELEAVVKKTSGDSDTERAELGRRIEEEGGIDALLGRAAKADKKKHLGIGIIIAGAVVAALTAWNFLAIVGIIVAVIGIIVGVALAAKGNADRKKGLLGELPAGKDGHHYCEECVETYRRAEQYKKERSDAEEKKKNTRFLVDRLQSDLVRAMERVRSTAAPTVENARAEAGRIDSFVRAYRELGIRADTLRERTQRDREILSAYNETELREGLDAAELPNITVNAAEEKQRFCKEKLSKLRERETGLRTELINLKARGEDPNRLMDALEAVRCKYDEAERFYNALTTAMQGIDRAAETLRGNVTPTIGRNASEYIAGITDGRYTDVNLGGDLGITLVDERELTTTSAMMSGGMRDAAYLALRISLMRSIFCEELPPLMMDETLCQLDGERTERAIRMLEQLGADGMQILLFTCHEREAEICRLRNIEANLIRMGR